MSRDRAARPAEQIPINFAINQEWLSTFANIRVGSLEHFLVKNSDGLTSGLDQNKHADGRSFKKTLFKLIREIDDTPDTDPKVNEGRIFINQANESAIIIFMRNSLDDSRRSPAIQGMLPEEITAVRDAVGVVLHGPKDGWKRDGTFYKPFTEAQRSAAQRIEDELKALTRTWRARNHESEPAAPALPLLDPLEEKKL